MARGWNEADHPRDPHTGEWVEAVDARIRASLPAAKPTYRAMMLDMWKRGQRAPWELESQDNDDEYDQERFELFEPIWKQGISESLARQNWDPVRVDALFPFKETYADHFGIAPDDAADEYDDMLANPEDFGLTPDEALGARSHDWLVGQLPVESNHGATVHQIKARRLADWPHIANSGEYSVESPDGTWAVLDEVYEDPEDPGSITIIAGDYDWVAEEGDEILIRRSTDV